MSTIILGGSGFLGPQILKKYPDIISVGRTKPVSAVHHVDCPSIEHLPKVLDKLDALKLTENTINLETAKDDKTQIKTADEIVASGVEEKRASEPDLPAI